MGTQIESCFRQNAIFTLEVFRQAIGGSIKNQNTP